MIFYFSCFQISSRFLKPNKKTADLVGNEKMKASHNVRHIVLPCSSSARSQLIPDIIRCYSRLVFFFLVNNNACFLSLVLGKLFVNLFSCTEMYVSDSVEAAQSFSLRLRKLLLNLLGCCLEHVLCMGTYSRVNAR